MPGKQDNFVWQDREIRFDCPPSQLECRQGEDLLDSINSVEDTKGNGGERGSLLVTNLRILWVSHRVSQTNLSIGFNSVLSINIKKARSKLRGNTQALCIMTKFQSCRFEFIFTSLVKNSPRLFTTVQAVLRAYETTTLYRDLKLRGSVVRNMQLITLPSEEIYNQARHSLVQGVWNLSSDQGNLGTFFITNIRLVWHANLAQNFNVSIPYIQMKSIRVRESKFGQALVVETSPKSGPYILGFRIDPPEHLEQVFKEINSLHQVYSVSPIFGVQCNGEDKPPAIEQRSLVRAADAMEIVGEEEGEGEGDSFALYFAEANKAADREASCVVFDAGLGLAVESLPSGATTSSLWRVV
ncbi:unnamed protein product [Discosporangium mesarthrocarpum]